MKTPEMDALKPKLEAALVKAGYICHHQSAYDKWTLGRCRNVWIGGRQVRTTINTDGTVLVEKIIGHRPNGSVSEAQQGRFDSWYTDDYRSYGTAAI